MDDHGKTYKEKMRLGLETILVGVLDEEGNSTTEQHQLQTAFMGGLSSKTCSTSVVYDNKMFLFGGTPAENGMPYSSGLFCLDLINGIDQTMLSTDWKEVSSNSEIPEGRIYHTMVVDGTGDENHPPSFIIFGGFTTNRR